MIDHRFVSLTLLGAAAIVPALLARRLFDAKAVVAEAERIRASLISPEPSRSGPGAEMNTRSPAHQSNEMPGASRDLIIRRIEKAIVPFPMKPIAGPVWFFSSDVGDQDVNNQGRDGKSNSNSRDRTHAPGPFATGILFPPIRCAAETVPGGVSVSWIDNPANPPGSILKTQVFRWNDAQAPQPIFVTEAQEFRWSAPAESAPHSGPPAEPPARRFIDSNICYGMRYSYAVITIQLDKIEGIEVRRSALGDTASVDTPDLYKFEVVGFDPNEKPQPGPRGARNVILRILDLGAQGAQPREVKITAPWRAESVAPGERQESARFRDAGEALGFECGWTCEFVRSETRDELVNVTIPIFHADGSRKVENGHPVAAVRTEMQTREYPIAHLRDRCGRTQQLQAPAPPPPEPPR